jgi:hypothetical protein
LTLSSEKPVSKFAFKFNLYRYAEPIDTDMARSRREWEGKYADLHAAEVGLYKCQFSWNHSLKTPGFNP